MAESVETPKQPRLTRRLSVVLVLLVAVFAVRAILGLFLAAYVVETRGALRPSWEVAAALVRNSPALFGRSATPSLERLAAGEWGFEIDALTALARLSPSRATGVLELKREQVFTEGGWWAPAAPAPEMLDLWQTNAGGSPSPSYGLDRKRKHGCQIRAPSGRTYVVYPDPYLGSDYDLWLFEIGGQAVPLFLGLAYESTVGVSHDGLLCSWTDETLTLDWAAIPPKKPKAEDEKDCCCEPRPPPPSTSFFVPDLAKDTDGDGLPDSVEDRLGTDIANDDTDLDGLIDSVDRSPNGGWQPPLGSKESAIRDLVDAVLLVSDPNCQYRHILFVATERAIEWHPRCGPTVNVSPDAIESQPHGSDIVHIVPYGADSSSPLASVWTEPTQWLDRIVDALKPEGIPLLYVNDHLGSDSEGYELRMRRHEERWHLVWQKMLWF